jgi:hypothetical protein
MFLKLSGRKTQSAPLPVSPRSKLQNGKFQLDDVLGDSLLFCCFLDFLRASLCQENLAAVQTINAFRTSSGKLKVNAT